jgi:hypothetical protein
MHGATGLVSLINVMKFAVATVWGRDVSIEGRLSRHWGVWALLSPDGHCELVPFVAKTSGTYIS